MYSLRRVLTHLALVLIAMLLLRLGPTSQTSWKSLLRPPNLANLSIVPSYIRSYSSKPDMKSYSYRLSASFSAKQHKLDLATNRYSHDPIALNASSVPSNLSSMKPSQRRRKRYQSGQDAFFVTTVPSSGSVALSVVDGVGGWVDSGVDPADFAHSLCEYMASRVITSEDQVDPKPLALLQSGYERVMQDDSIAAGGSTACVAVATKTGHLEVAKLVVPF